MKVNNGTKTFTFSSELPGDYSSEGCVFHIRELRVGCPFSDNRVLLGNAITCMSFEIYFVSMTKTPEVVGDDIYVLAQEPVADKFIVEGSGVARKMIATDMYYYNSEDQPVEVPYLKINDSEYEILLPALPPLPPAPVSGNGEGGGTQVTTHNIDFMSPYWQTPGGTTFTMLQGEGDAKNFYMKGGRLYPRSDARTGDTVILQAWAQSIVVARYNMTFTRMSSIQKVITIRTYVPNVKSVTINSQTNSSAGSCVQWNDNQLWLDPSLLTGQCVVVSMTLIRTNNDVETWLVTFVPPNAHTITVNTMVGEAISLPKGYALTTVIPNAAPNQPYANGKFTLAGSFTYKNNSNGNKQLIVNVAGAPTRSSVVNCYTSQNTYTYFWQADDVQALSLTLDGIDVPFATGKNFITISNLKQYADQNLLLSLSDGEEITIEILSSISTYLVQLRLTQTLTLNATIDGTVPEQLKNIGGNTFLISKTWNGTITITAGNGAYVYTLACQPESTGSASVTQGDGNTYTMIPIYTPENVYFYNQKNVITSYTSSDGSSGSVNLIDANLLTPPDVNASGLQIPFIVEERPMQASAVRIGLLLLNTFATISVGYLPVLLYTDGTHELLVKNVYFVMDLE